MNEVKSGFGFCQYSEIRADGRRPERPSFDSPGQSPGFRCDLTSSPVRAKRSLAGKSRVAVSPFQGFFASRRSPRALPWAIELRPVGAEIQIKSIQDLCRWVRLMFGVWRVVGVWGLMFGASDRKSV